MSWTDVGNRPRFVLSGLCQMLLGKYFTVSKFPHKHEYLQYNKNLKQNQNSCSINAPSPVLEHRNESQRSRILRPIIIKKTQTPHRKKKQLDMYGTKGTEV